MQTSPEKTIFSAILLDFLKSILSLKHFQKKKDDPHSSCISEITDSVKRL